MERKNNTAARGQAATEHATQQVSQMRRRFTPVPLQREEPLSRQPRQITRAPGALGKTARDGSAVSRRSTQPGFTAVGVPTPQPRLALSCVPRRVLSDDALLALPLDHRAGFVLAHIDGATEMHDLIDICGMPQEEVASVFERLLELRAIALK